MHITVWGATNITVRKYKPKGTNRKGFGFCGQGRGKIHYYVGTPLLLSRYSTTAVQADETHLLILLNSVRIHLVKDAKLLY